MLKRLPNQRWYIYSENKDLAQQLADAQNIAPVIGQLLINRGIENSQQAEAFLNPESLVLAPPLDEFPDLALSLQLLQNAILNQEKIAICGDYDADGMTSTALLLRSLRWLGAKVDYAIPSRMHDGYGINIRIVEEFQREGVGLILTVDNGISAYEPIKRARELGLKVIVTDHHDIPQQLPPANAILNPKLIPESSVYRSIAGVGVAYILAVSLAQKISKDYTIILKPILELFTLGTIADLAPLTGVNRRWVKRGLQQLPKSKLAGVQALIEVAGVQARGDGETSSTPNSSLQTPNSKSLKPEDIGFRLGPRINAIGRIGDPQIVIDLLTTDDMAVARARAIECEMTNTSRQQMCEQIEAEAVAWVSRCEIDLQTERVLVVVRPNWHHGVIGIVASRLLERYGVPVFIGTYEDECHIRGSARGIPEFNVFHALEYCHDLLGKYGGHKAAGGFSLLAENLPQLRERLSEFANQCLEIHHLKPLLKIDALLDFNQINQKLYQQLNRLHPCGIDNPDPVFWTPGVQVVEQRTIGKGHIKVTLVQIVDNQRYTFKAIAWRWRDFFPLPSQVDIAYKLRENYFNGNVTIELELSGVRLPIGQNGILSNIESRENVAKISVWDSELAIFHHLFNPKKLTNTEDRPPRANFDYNQRAYSCGIFQHDGKSELRIRNSDNKVLVVQAGNSIGLLGTNRQESREVNISQAPYKDIVEAALKALALND